MKNIVKCILISFFAYSCANIAAPTGGEKDIVPPNLLSSIPKHQSTEYKGKIVVLEFDEAIEINNLKKNLIITPDENNEYKYTLNDNVLKIEFEKAFSENTTYVFNFGEALTDVTEKNKVKNLRVAFSTGLSIDSLSIHGEVFEAQTLKSVSNCVVGIYKANDTLDIQNSKPLYFTYTDSLGFYKIENIKQGNYKLYALQEGKKADKKYNAEDEKIAFWADTLKLESFSANRVNLPLVYYDNKEFKVLNAKPRRQYFEIATNKDIYDCRIIYTDSSSQKRFFYTLDKKIVQFYNPTEEADSVAIQAILKDSIGTEIRYDTRIKFDKYTGKRKIGGFVLDAEPASGMFFNPNDTLKLVFKFNKPLAEYALDSISYRRDRDTLVYRFSEKDIELDSTRLRMKVKKPILFKEQISLEIKPKAFISIEADSSELRPFMYSIKQEANYGSLSGVIRTQEKNYFVQVLDKDGKVEGELQNAKVFNFKLISTGMKQIRILIDDNGNGVWDSGNWKQKMPPERVKMFKVDTEVKANWVVEDVLIELDQ